MYCHSVKFVKTTKLSVVSIMLSYNPRLLYNMKDFFGCMRKRLLIAKVPTADIFGTGRHNFRNKNCDSFFANRNFSAAKFFLKYQSPTYNAFLHCESRFLHKIVILYLSIMQHSNIPHLCQLTVLACWME